MLSSALTRTATFCDPLRLLSPALSGTMQRLPKSLQLSANLATTVPQASKRMEDVAASRVQGVLSLPMASRAGTRKLWRMSRGCDDMVVLPSSLPSNGTRYRLDLLLIVCL